MTSKNDFSEQLVQSVIHQKNESTLQKRRPSKVEDEHFHSHSNISSVSLYFKKPIYAVTLTLFLEVLAETLGSNLIRIKGLVFIKEAKETPAIVHGVQHVFHAISWHESWPERRGETQLVFIGRDLSLQWIEALKCLNPL